MLGATVAPHPNMKINSSPLKIDRILKGKDRLPSIVFQGRDVKLRGGAIWIGESKENDVLNRIH